MKAVILAGGASLGTFPLTRTVPRALLPVANRPLVSHSLRQLAEGGFEEGILCGSGDMSAFSSSLGSQCGAMQLIYRSSDLPCGAAGCLRLAQDRLHGDPFLVLESTILVDVDFARFLADHAGRAAAVVATVALDTSGPSWNGALPATTPAGIYAFAPSALRYLRRPGYRDIKEQLLPEMADAREEVTYVPIGGAHRFVRDIGSLLAVNCQVLEGCFPRLFRTDALRELAPRVWAEDAVATGPNARLIGPILFGPDATVGANATLVGPLAIGPRCRIGDGALVRESVLWGDNAVEKDARMYRCVINRGAVLPEGLRAEEAAITEESLSPTEARTLRQIPYRVSDLGPHPDEVGAAPEPELDL